MRERDADVVVVGAGPVGLLLACELALGGVKAVVLERLARPDPTIKAGAIHALAGEALERRGLGPAMDAEEAAMVALMKERLGPAPLEAMKKIGGHFAGLFLIDQTMQREPTRRLRGVNQQALERILTNYSTALGVEVLRERDVTGFDSSGEDIVVHLDGGTSMRAQWLVGCDGGRSRVRKLAGFDFEGSAPTITGYQAIATVDHVDRLMPLGWRRTRGGMMAIGPVPGRIFVVEFDGPPADRDAPITSAELEAALRRVSGADVRILEVQTVTRFTDHARQATTYRRGRVLLAGDAAHVHSPFGGQGLNLGIGDAVNLGWKLAAVIRGEGKAELLETYTSERHPVGARVLANTRAQVALMRPDDHTTALRDVVSQIMLTEEGNRFFGEMISGTTTRYELGSEDPRVGRFLGDRSLYPHMVDGVGLFVDAGLEGVELPASVRRVSANGPESMLVRPDGCIAWIGTDAAGVRNALARWFYA